jgi:hypothetical protein
MAQPTWDLFIYLFLAVAVVLFGLTLGRQRIVSILMSVYLSLVVVNYLPFLDKELGEVNINLGFFAFKLSSFVLIFILTFLVLSRSAVLHEAAGAGRGLLSSFLFSFLFLGMLLSIVLSFLPVAALNFFSPFTRELFTSHLSRFLWIILPMIAMAVLKGKADN